MVMKNGRLSAKDFFADLHEDDEQKADATKVEKPVVNPAESYNVNKRVRSMTDWNASRENDAREVEEHAKDLREAARKGVGAKGESDEGQPISRQKANDYIHGYEGAEDWENVALQQRGFKTYPNPKDPKHPISNYETYEENKTYKPAIEADERQRKEQGEIEQEKAHEKKVKADTFETNLHKYDKEKHVLSSSKLPETVARPKAKKSWVKSFFEGVK